MLITKFALLLALAMQSCPFYATPATVAGIWPEPEGMMICYEFNNGNGYVADYLPETGLEEGDAVVIIADKRDPKTIYDDILIAVATSDGYFNYGEIL